jgi:hypothetical protein
MNCIENNYKYYFEKTSDINEHLPTLYKYASECDSVFETGVRGCISSWALAYGLLQNNLKDKPTFFLNDIDECDIRDLLFFTKDLPIIIKHEWKNNLELDLKETYDLTFIDTWHVYGQLKRELAKFAPSTNKYIIMHDTTVDEWEGETIRMGMNATEQSASSGFSLEEINKGLWPAVDEFLLTNKDWVLHERFVNNNGLTILRKIH